MPKKSNDQPAGLASNTGIFHTGMSGNSGMTGSTGAPGNTVVIDSINLADTVGSSKDTNEREYSKKGMEQMGLTASVDPSNSGIEGGWDLSDVKDAIKKGKKDNSFRDLG